MKRHPIPLLYRSQHPHPCDDHLPPDLHAGLQQRITEVATSTVELARGENLAHSGAAFHHLYLVVSGAFKAVQLGAEGRSQIVCFYGPRELMGLSGFSQRRYTTDLSALMPSVVCEFPVQAIESAVSADRLLLERLLTYVSEGLERAEQDQFMLGSLTAPQKIACFLLRVQAMRRRIGGDANGFDLPMTREELGSYLGLTMETISRLLSHLHAQGVARIDKRHVQILRDDLLQAWRDEGVDLPLSKRKKSPELRVA
ncbi:MAG: Crp/Fnr family transcriptional regulator [Thiomonas sp. 20-64-5]|nr:MAG: Crp/Fnr family transcriptional regulator [Thiomonas sp. 20-64-5]